MCHLHERTLISQIFYIFLPNFEQYLTISTQVKCMRQSCIQLDVISIYPWNFYTQELGNNQHADVIWGEIIFELMKFGIIAYIFLRLRVWIATVHCTNKICTVPIHQEIWILTCTSNIFMPKDQMTGGILFLSCLSVVNINICYNFLTICDRDFIWHAYSTNKALSNDSGIHSENPL